MFLRSWMVMRLPKPSVRPLLLSVLGTVVALGSVAAAAGPNVRGRIKDQEKLVRDIYAEAASPESHRWSWREPSPSVQSQYRNLASNPSRELCIAATSSSGGGSQDPVLMTVTGGRIVPTTIVVGPGRKLVFKNFDPFPHKIYIPGQKSFAAEVINPDAQREWSAPGPGRYEFRDELFPSVKTFVVVDPQVVAIAYPGRDGSFGFTLPKGDYVLKAFFGGNLVGKPVAVIASDRGTDLKEPMSVGDDAKGDSK